ncbi:MAG: class I SAM-dependent methyltransferase [Planctomycetes bacterium]|nr:class I SAM-dependent methyltransferase [Planctomycetota bacterium]
MPRTLEPEYMDTEEEANGYDAMDHTTPNAAFVGRLAYLGAQGQVLDLGCGPGHIEPLVCEAISGARVTGVDAAGTMLALAEGHRAKSPHRDRIAYLRADVKSLPFEDASYDAVFSNTVMHHIPDPLPFLREARRVLRPGGALLIRDLFRPDEPELALALVAKHAADASPYQQELFRASLHAALTTDELDAIAKNAGLTGYEITLDSDRHMSLQIAAT